MPQVLVPVISAIGTAMGGAWGATFIMYAVAIATSAPIIGRAFACARP